MSKDKTAWRSKRDTPMDMMEELDDSSFRITLLIPGLKPGSIKSSPKNGKANVTVHASGKSLSVEVTVEDKAEKLKTFYPFKISRLPSPVKQIRQNEADDELSDWKTEKGSIVITLRKCDPSISWTQIIRDTGGLDQTSSSDSD